MAQEEKSEGIVLRAMEYKERQRIITIFTQNVGLISLVVKGLSRKNLSLLSITTPLCKAEFIYLRGTSDLGRFRDGSVVDEHLFLRAKLSHLQTAGQLAQAVLASQLPGRSAPLLYALLSGYLAHLASFDDPTPLAASFYLKLLKHEGVFSIDAQAPNFTQPEWSTLCALLAVTNFTQLQAIHVPPELLLKISDHFYREIGR